MNDAYAAPRHDRPGFRLHKLEVFNWGTFDSTQGTVHSVRPGGQNTLLIGQNGCGKSTLVDALLTMLVRPVVRNYNVAAGARKQERDERTYLKGACGRFSRDEDNRAEVQFLRPGSSHYSVLLASFANEQSGAAFTVAQVLYMASDHRVEKIYCLSPGERSIAADFGGITSTEKLRQQLQQRGFRATQQYSELHQWLIRLTGMRPKAMDMFNQTVAVKDIQSLNRFIRDHMLEAKPWGEKVDSLLSHFTQLSEAHQSLLRVRRQAELLDPIATLGKQYTDQAQQLREAREILDASNSYFRQATLALLGPHCERLKVELASLAARKAQLASDIAEAQQESRRLQNEIELAGGERLRQIPLLIHTLQLQVEARQQVYRRYHDALRQAGVSGDVTDATSFQAVQQWLPKLLQELDQQLAADEAARDERVMQRGELHRAIEEDQRELLALSQRQANLPESFAQLRNQLCDELRLPPRDMPFVAELIAVQAEQRAWEASIEMVLRGFALSLLVPERYYALVTAYINRTRLADARGRGQRLVYLKVGPRNAPAAAQPLHPQSMLRKLAFREGHSLLPWLKAELEERFDYRCCDTIEQFQQTSGLALTRERHVKIRDVRHEKDDRERTADPRHFVLGWDNREKRQRLGESLRQMQAQMQQLNNDIARITDRATVLRQRQHAATQAREVTDYAAMDFAGPQSEITALQLERRSLEESNDVLRMLKQRRSEAEQRERSLQAQRDDVVRSEGQLQRDLDEALRLIAGAQSVLEQRQAEGILDRHRESFAAIDEQFRTSPLTAEDLFERERQFTEEHRVRTNQLAEALEPVAAELTKAMNRYLREFPDERADLEATVQYLTSFLGLGEQIRREDLPRHEQRFKQRLNEKVIQEIGLLNGALQSERGEIIGKIDLLNQSLRQLEYRPGTHMRLEPRAVREREIVEFQDALKECLAGTFEGSAQADEARYLRIEKLIHRLRDELRWREKVTDVRRWFDFVAREIDDASGAERGYYEDSTGQSGGEKAKLAFTILVAAIAYQYDLNPEQPNSDRFHFVVVDEMFSKVDDQYAEYALELFRKFGLQLLIVAPLDAKARVTEPYVGCYLHVAKDLQTNHSTVLSMSARGFQDVLDQAVNEVSVTGR